jgi:uncharacterized protein involved in exopolysaccharide biosynthesis
MRIEDLKFSNLVPTLRENSKFILIVSLASCVTSFLGAEMLMDGRYRSEAEILVLYGAGSAIGSRTSDRSAVLVREKITQRSLERVIVDNGLYPRERRNGSLAEALKAIEQDISTSVVRDDVVRLAFQASDPGLAQRVTSQLASQYEGGVNQAPGQEDRVLLSLSDQIKKAEADLARQEEKIKDFNLRFLGGHLERQTATLATLNRLILQLQSNADLLNGLQEQKSSQERALIQQERHPSSEPVSEPPDSKLQLGTQTADSLAQSNPSGLTFAERQVKIDQFNREIDQRRRQQAEIRKEMAVYQAKIDSAPKVRALQSAIVRDYDNAKLHYQKLLAKKNEAEMAKAAKTKMEPSFQVLSPASFPDTPSNSRHQFMAKLSGLLWGPLVAIGLVTLRRRTVEQKVSLEEVIRQSGVPVLASIPWIPLGSVQPNTPVPDRDSHRSSTETT